MSALSSLSQVLLTLNNHISQSIEDFVAKGVFQDRNETAARSSPKRRVEFYGVVE
jgi:hypothetical protein